jgi:5-methylcytosine-specific restriction endonuclease McrA
MNTVYWTTQGGCNDLCIGEYSHDEILLQLYYINEVDSFVNEKKFDVRKGSKNINLRLDGYEVCLSKKRVKVMLQNNVCAYCGRAGNIWKMILPRLYKLGSAPKHIKPYLSLVYRECNNSEHDILMTIDHVIPMSKGGTSSFKNLVTACEDCNQKKDCKLLSDEENDIMLKNGVVFERNNPAISERIDRGRCDKVISDDDMCRILLEQD